MCLPIQAITIDVNFENKIVSFTINHNQTDLSVQNTLFNKVNKMIINNEKSIYIHIYTLNGR